MTVSVCLSVREHISRTTSPIVTNFCSLCPWLGPPLAALQYVMYCTSGFMDVVIFAHNGPYAGVPV